MSDDVLGHFRGNAHLPTAFGGVVADLGGLHLIRRTSSRSYGSRSNSTWEPLTCTHRTVYSPVEPVMTSRWRFALSFNGLPCFSNSEPSRYMSTLASTVSSDSSPSTSVSRARQVA